MQKYAFINNTYALKLTLPNQIKETCKLRIYEHVVMVVKTKAFACTKKSLNVQLKKQFLSQILKKQGQNFKMYAKKVLKKTISAQTFLCWRSKKNQEIYYGSIISYRYLNNIIIKLIQ